jgi:hypothetical protein
MKKTILYIALFLIGTIIGFTSCQKEQIVIQPLYTPPIVYVPDPMWNADSCGWGTSNKYEIKKLVGQGGSTWVYKTVLNNDISKRDTTVYLPINIGHNGRYKLKRCW